MRDFNTQDYDLALKSPRVRVIQGIYLGYIGIMEKILETTIVYWAYIGIMEKKMETTIVYWGFIGISEKTMETTKVYWGYIGIMKLLSDFRKEEEENEELGFVSRTSMPNSCMQLAPEMRAEKTAVKG